VSLELGEEEEDVLPTSLHRFGGIFDLEDVPIGTSHKLDIVGRHVDSGTHLKTVFGSC
jgi:hypothetical protein